MSHISSLGAAIFTDLSVSTGTINSSGVSTQAANTTLTDPGWKALFATEGVLADGTGATSFMRLGNVREFPQVGTPANIVNVPVFGQKQSSTVQGQADAPTLDLTINLIPALWAKGTSRQGLNALANMVSDGISRPWRFTLLLNAPTPVTIATCATSSVAPATAGVCSGGTIVGDIFTLTTYTSGVFRAGTTLSGGTVVAGTIILDQLTGTAGGSSGATYRVNTSQNATGITGGVTSTLTLGAVPSVAGPFTNGSTISGGAIPANTKIYSQISGTIGGSNGATYSVNGSITQASTTITASGDNCFTYASTDTTGIGYGGIANTQYFWNGKLEALLLKPDLKDTLTATLTLSIQSDFYGGYTNT